MYNQDIIKNEILQGLLQVDSSFILDDFSCSVKERKLTVNFTAHTEDGESVEVSDLWQ